jgi:hypothetical protein
MFAMGRAFETRHFARWIRKTQLTERALRPAVWEMAAFGGAAHPA